MDYSKTPLPYYFLKIKTFQNCLQLLKFVMGFLSLANDGSFNRYINCC